jgi:hypothetical protein
MAAALAGIDVMDSAAARSAAALYVVLPDAAGIVGGAVSVGVAGDVLSPGVVVIVDGGVLSLGAAVIVDGDVLSLGVDGVDETGVTGVVSTGVDETGVTGVVSIGVDETGVTGVLSGGADGGLSIAPGAVADGNVSELLVSSPVSCVSSVEICCSSCCICCNCACIGWSEPAVVGLAFALAASLPEVACICSTPDPTDVRFPVAPDSLLPPIPRVLPDLPDLPELPKRNGAILDIQELLGTPLVPLALNANGEDCPCVTPLVLPAVCAAVALVLGANNESGVCAVFVHVLESFCCSTLSVLLLFTSGEIT